MRHPLTPTRPKRRLPRRSLHRGDRQLWVVSPDPSLGNRAARRNAAGLETPAPRAVVSEGRAGQLRSPTARSVGAAWHTSGLEPGPAVVAGRVGGFAAHVAPVGQRVVRTRI